MSFISLRGVHKKYGNYAAVKNLSFEIKKGEMVALLGPNGAGKSTIMQMLLGLKTPTSGEIIIDGKAAGHPVLRTKVGVTPQDLSFSPHLKVREILNWVARVQGQTVDDLYFKKFGLDEFAEQLAGNLSGGQKRRLGLALAFVGAPEVVILDEPTTGLDVQGKMQMWEYLEDYARQGGTVILTTHDLYELSRLHCRMLMIDQGQLLREGNVHEMISLCEYKRVSFRSPAAVSFQADAKIETFKDHTVCWTLYAEEIVRELVDSKVEFSDLQVQMSDIDQVFRLMRENI